MPTEAFRTNKRISRRKYAINHFPLHWVYASMKYLSKKKNLVSDGGEFNRLLCLHRPPEKRLEFKKFNYPVSIGASVVVPVYNVEQYLNECLSALLCDNASENQYEVIAVNDGSSDGSGQILEQWAKQTRKLKVINQPNGGLSAARNTGLNEAKGEYVAFVDSDDVMNIESILDLIAALKKSHADYASGLYQRVDDVGRILSPVDYISSTMVPWGRVYKRSLWEDVRFPVGY